MERRVTRNNRPQSGLVALSALFAVCLALPATSSAAAVQVSAGYDHSCALLKGGTVTCWGSNQYGQLGDGTTTARTGPVVVTGVSNVKELVTGWQSSCALLEDTTVKCWGRNDKGQLGDGTFTDRQTPASVYKLTGATDIASGWQHRCAPLNTGAVWCWGRNDGRQLGITTRVAPFAEPKPVQVPNLSGVNRIALGFQHSCALQPGGSVKCWGLNSAGQLGDGLPINLSALSATPKTVMDGSGALSGATMLESGIGNHSCIVKDDATVKCWGMNMVGELGDGTTTSSSSPRSAATSSPVTSMSLGWEHSCVVIASSSVECWGWNRYGQLGDGSRTNRLSATPVSGLTSPTAVAGGFGHSCAIANVGRVYCWGRNLTGQLGDGTTNESTSPVEVPNMVDPPGFTSQPQPQTLATSHSISFTGESGATFECSTDGAAFEACASPVPLSGLSAGDHTFRVRQSTTLGTSNPATAVWTVDLDPPVAPNLTQVPATVINSRSATVVFTGESGASFTCSLDDGPDYPCTSPTRVTGAADGQHTLEVTQTDAAGNTGATTLAIWTVDTVSPRLTGRVSARTSGRDTVLATTFAAGLGKPAKLGWTTARSRPTASARPARGRVLAWAPRLVVRNATGLHWVRVGDRVGNWSSWVKVG
jgi:alpha-tubulin suppressor-like RCC1 family protein